jgi:tRNA U55 pseudouridine synthase TruB
MEPTAELVDAIYRDKVMRSRKMTIGRRVEVGAELSDLGRQMMREAIRRDMPGSSQQEIQMELRRRIALSRKLDDIPLPTV